MGEAGVLKFSI